jgi:hypothetical protein
MYHNQYKFYFNATKKTFLDKWLNMEQNLSQKANSLTLVQHCLLTVQFSRVQKKAQKQFFFGNPGIYSICSHKPSIFFQILSLPIKKILIPTIPFQKHEALCRWLGRQWRRWKSREWKSSLPCRKHGALCRWWGRPDALGEDKDKKKLRMNIVFTFPEAWSPLQMMR